MLHPRRWIPAVSLPVIGIAALLAAGGLQEKKEPEVKDLDAFLDELYRYGVKNNMWNVRPADGKFLEVLISAVGARRLLELGTSNGYSGIWIGRAIRETGGKLVTLEIDPAKAAEARANFAKVGMDDLIEVRVGDAAALIPALKEKFHVIFMGTEKGDYLEHFRLALPLLEPGGVFLSHNVILMRDSMKDYLDAVNAHPELSTAIVQTSDDGFSVSYRIKTKDPGKKK